MDYNCDYKVNSANCDYKVNSAKLEFGLSLAVLLFPPSLAHCPLGPFYSRQDRLNVKHPIETVNSIEAEYMTIIVSH